MYLLSLYFEEERSDLGLFDTLEHGRACISQCPGYQYIKEDGFDIEFLKVSYLPDYLELDYQGHRIPLSRFSFPGADRVEIVWQSLPNLSGPGVGLVEGSSRVDAYVIDNQDLDQYIHQRESRFQATKKYLQGQGFQVTRSFLGSQDGEAILYRSPDDPDWTFLTHLDPSFVEGGDLTNLLDDLLHE